MNPVNDNKANAQNYKVTGGGPDVEKVVEYSSNPVVAASEKNSDRFMSDWIGSRTAILQKNIDDMNPAMKYIRSNNLAKEEGGRQVERSVNTPVYATGTKEYDNLIDGFINDIRSEAFGNKDEQDDEIAYVKHILAANSADGMYKDGYILADSKASGTQTIITHEKAHAMEAAPQYEKIRSILKDAVIDRTLYETQDKGLDRYWDDPNEVYSRLMQFRMDNRLDPKKVYNENDIKSFKAKFHLIKQRQLLDRYDNKVILGLLNEVADSGGKDNKNIV